MNAILRKAAPGVVRRGAIAAALTATAIFGVGCGATQEFRPPPGAAADFPVSALRPQAARIVDGRLCVDLAPFVSPAAEPHDPEGSITVRTPRGVSWRMRLTEASARELLRGARTVCVEAPPVALADGDEASIIVEARGLTRLGAAVLRGGALVSLGSPTLVAPTRQVLEPPVPTVAVPEHHEPPPDGQQIPPSVNPPYLTPIEFDLPPPGTPVSIPVQVSNLSAIPFVHGSRNRIYVRVGGRTGAVYVEPVDFGDVNLLSGARGAHGSVLALRLCGHAWGEILAAVQVVEVRVEMETGPPRAGVSVTPPPAAARFVDCMVDRSGAAPGAALDQQCPSNANATDG
ncbi:MAG TPA: hypothetical protein VEI02_11975 [Planctomycetota bacterium]|nr:hypothetical protein [Planctomycetota bacterium]